VTINEAREIIYQYLVSNWSPPSPTVPYTFDGESFDSKGKAEYIRLSVHQAGRDQHTLGGINNRVFRSRGFVLIQIFVQADRGLLRLDALGKTALDLYEGKTISQVAFNAGQYRERPDENKSDGTWRRGNVTVPFTYDEIK